MDGDASPELRGPGAEHDPGTASARERADRVGLPGSDPIRTATGGSIRFGTASWADPTLTRAGVFYPEGESSAEARLRYYASCFPLVEVDTTYYALPTRRMAAAWCERTPVHFTFDVKAYALFTGQPSEIDRLPPHIRNALPAALAAKQRVYGKDLPAELYDAVWAAYVDALEPLRSSGKLGAVLLQYPRWFVPGHDNREQILDAQRRLGDIGGTVELRNALWYSERNAERTLRFFEEHDIPLVIVDEPQGLRSSVPAVVDVTSSRLAVFRFHGRRADLWERRNIAAAERFRYLYDAAELAPWAPRIIEIAGRTREAHVIMNNCYANYGTTNAAELAALVRSHGAS